jgi:hypothetical protein
VVGYLIIRSAYSPKTLGVMMQIAGVDVGKWKARSSANL